MKHSILKTLALGAVLLAPALGSAQDVAPLPDDPAAHSETVAERNPENDVRLQLTAGAALAYGNARNFAINLGGNFTIREDQHAFLVELGWIYGLAAARGADPMMPNEFGDFVENANNLTGRMRYDYFVDDDNAIFVVLRGRRDPFANLEPRVQAQAGYMRNLLREENHRFWVEIGADLSYDSFASGARLVVGVDSTGANVDSTDRSLLSARGFIGYSNEINSALTWKSGLEVLWVFYQTPADIDLGHFRFEWINQFRSSIEDWLQISLDITMRLDTQPPGQSRAWDEQAGQPTQMFDLISTLNLVGNFDIDGAPVAEEEPEPEPEPVVCPVCPEPEPCPVCQEVPAVVAPVVEPPPADAVEAGAEAGAEAATDAAVDAATAE